ncbi:uncharacterized protein LOC144785692 [Lissotriton helveticus]
MMNSTAALALLPAWWLLACALGLPPAPQMVRLVSEDFYSSLSWILDTTSAASEFEVQIYASGFEDPLNWTPVNATCKEMNISWRCDLSSYFQDLHHLYRARVRTLHSDSTSNWTMSNELNPYRDVTLGPPEVVLRVQGQELLVDVGTRFTPLKNAKGTPQRVHEVLQKMKCNITIYEGARQVDHDLDSSCSGRIPYTIRRSLRGSTEYCVLVRISFHQRKLSSASKCAMTSSGPPDFLSMGLILGCLVLALVILGSPALIFVIKSLHTDPAKMPTPRTLQIVQNSDSRVVFWSSGPDESWKVDSVALEPIDQPARDGMPETEGETSALQPVPGEYDFQHDHGYHSSSAPDSSQNEAYLGTSLAWSSNQEAPGATGLWEDCGSSASDPIVSESAPGLPAQPSSSLEVHAGGSVHAVDTQGQDPASQEKAESAMYRGAGKTPQCPLDIPLDSVLLQAILGPMDERALGDFFDSGSDESAEDNSLDSQHVDSGHEDGPLIPHGEPSEDENICGYWPRDQPFSGYEARADAFSEQPAHQNEVTPYFQRPGRSMVFGAPNPRANARDTEESDAFLRNT